jgi:cytochrome c oxidase cbb3-type subunit I/II
LSSHANASADPVPPQTTPAAKYDEDIVKMFTVASLVWGAVGMLVGVIIALQIAWWPANLGLPWTTFGRLRPLHTNAVIFAFGGNVVFTAIYYSMQRLLKTRMWSDRLSRFHFWGWQLIIVAAAITLPLGMTQSKEYAELIWPIDIAITVVWVAFAINFFGTLAIRKVKHMYVAIWFYMSFVITIAVLHIVNSIAIPATLFRSYPVYAGLTDALVQWWYGHNAVGFFLTTPFLGLMYYFLPRAAERPVYSYRLSIIHFWALVFLYIWAGPHHLLYSALPEWAQTLGMVFSVMLLAPSWGGMLNGLLTLRGAWHRLRTDPVLKFMVVAVSFYGMSTFEGPMMSIRAVNSLAHYTNWVVGHVHSGALGWNGMVAFGMFYWLVPRLWNREWAYPKLPTTHFWLATIGIVLYTVAMWAAGLMEGLQWRAINETGQLANPIFLDIVFRLEPFYWLRLLGGTLYLIGMVMMLVNFFRTIRGPETGFQDSSASATA